MVEEEAEEEEAAEEEEEAEEEEAAAEVAVEEEAEVAVAAVAEAEAEWMERSRSFEARRAGRCRCLGVPTTRLPCYRWRLHSPGYMPRPWQRDSSSHLSSAPRTPPSYAKEIAGVCSRLDRRNRPRCRPSLSS